MSTAWILLIALLAASGPTPVTPYASDVPFDAAIPLDRHVAAQLAHAQITPAPLCSDAVFVRRVFLDATGTLPTTAEVRRFLADGSAEKRAALIDDLLARPEFADYWSLKWCDVLRVKAEFPINLWPNAVQAYHRWIHDALANNVPYDTFARDLLTSSGSNFRVPPVNFYRAVQGHEPEAIAEAVALTFMGTRLERWPAEQQRELAAVLLAAGVQADGGVERGDCPFSIPRPTQCSTPGCPTAWRSRSRLGRTRAWCSPTG